MRELVRESVVRYPGGSAARSREFRESNPGYTAEWGKQHPDRLIEYNRTWRKKHPERHCARSARYRARKKGAALGDSAAVKEFYAWLRETAIVICHWCRETVPQEFRRADHFIPLVMGGAHSLGNLVPACDSCNSHKGSRLPEDFLLTRK